MTRDEHIAWARRRALEYLDMGNVPSAVASFGSDLSKHEETRGLVDFKDVAMAAAEDGVAAVRAWIMGVK